jgi:hypothetical protein
VALKGTQKENIKFPLKLGGVLPQLPYVPSSVISVGAQSHAVTHTLEGKGEGEGEGIPIYNHIRHLA